MYGAVPVSEEYPDGRRPYSAEEEAEFNAREAQFINDKPMEDWKLKMAGTDSSMPRYLEDLITINSLTMTPEMKVRYDAKIKIRREQP